MSASSNSSKKSSSTCRYLAIKSLNLSVKDCRVFSIPDLYVFVTSFSSSLVNLLFNLLKKPNLLSPFIKTTIKVLPPTHSYLLNEQILIEKHQILASLLHITHLPLPLFLFDE